MLDRGLVRGVELSVVVTAAREPLQLLVAEVLHHRPQPRIGSEEVLADVGPALDRVLLELAVDRRVHLVDEHTVDVAREEVVPGRAPHDLDDVPAHAPEDRLELLDDLAVAAHRTVETLQVAVDDEDQVVEPFTRAERQRGHRLGLVELAVADEAPDLRVGRVGDLALVQVAVEAGLVHRVQRAETHRDGRELPERRHAPRVRVRRQSAFDLTPEPLELLLAQATFEERARVDAGRGVTLEEDLVAVAPVALAAEEVIETDFVQRRRRRVRREVATETVEPVVGAVDHDDRVPTDEGTDPAFDVFVAREPRLLLARDRVDVVGLHHRRDADALLARSLHEPSQQVVGA